MPPEGAHRTVGRKEPLRQHNRQEHSSRIGDDENRTDSYTDAKPEPASPHLRARLAGRLLLRTAGSRGFIESLSDRLDEAFGVRSEPFVRQPNGITSCERPDRWRQLIRARHP